MDWRTRRAIELMKGELHQPLTVASLARRLNLSTSRFTHLFRHDLGCPPARYLRNLRLDRARELAEESVLTAKEIMARVGFNDPSHFTRDFKLRHGASPRTVRARFGQRTAESANTPAIAGAAPEPILQTSMCNGANDISRRLE